MSDTEKVDEDKKSEGPTPEDIAAALQPGNDNRPETTRAGEASEQEGDEQETPHNFGRCHYPVTP